MSSVYRDKSIHKLYEKAKNKRKSSFRQRYWPKSNNFWQTSRRESKLLQKIKVYSALLEIFDVIWKKTPDNWKNVFFLFLFGPCDNLHTIFSDTFTVSQFSGQSNLKTTYRINQKKFIFHFNFPDQNVILMFSFLDKRENFKVWLTFYKKRNVAIRRC